MSATATTLREALAGQLTVCGSRQPDETAFRLAAEVIESGEPLVVVDGGGCFDPSRWTRSARFGELDPVRIMRQLRVLRAPTAADLERRIAELEGILEQCSTRHVLITGLLGRLYDPSLSTLAASRTLGRIKNALEQLANAGARIVICSIADPGVGTRSHFFPSLCASADRVLLSQ